FPYNDIDATAEVLEDNEDEVAALIIEPVLCGPGVIAPKANYLKRLRQLTRKRGIVLIFDEVLTGFRLAYGGAQEYYDIRPDMTTFGKIAGGGFQLAGFGGEAQIMNVLEPGRGWKYATFHAGTYNGHPISVAAGLKGLEILGEHPEYYDHINGLGRQLYSGLQDLADDRRIPAWVEYVGSIGNVYFTTKDEIRNFRDTLSANTRRWWNWFIHCLGNNVLFGIPNTGERAFLSTEHTDEDIEWALEVAGGAFAAIANGAPVWPLAIHLAAIEGGTPVSTTPPPTFHFLWGQVTASYRNVSAFPSFSPIKTQRWMSTSSSGSFGFGRLSITVEVASYGRTL